MIELHSDKLVFSFPALAARFKQRAHTWIDARLAVATLEEKSRLPSSLDLLYSKFDSCLPSVRASVSFQRTLRIPDDGHDYPLPPGLGRFPVRHVDDFAEVPEPWRKRGGVMLPMHKTEAMWLRFSADYPMALKIGAGGICAISGERWSSALRDSRQNYVVLPVQPWLDGFRVSEGVIRQFVAVPLGKGLTVEQQLTGEESWGGVQLQAFPIKAEFSAINEMEASLETVWIALTRPPEPSPQTALRYSRPFIRAALSCCSPDAAAGLGAGGRMKQEITAAPFGLDAWDTTLSSRCFVHLCLADDWRRLTGISAPHQPPTARDYARAGLPWFDYDAGKPAVTGETALSGVKSVNTLVGEKTGLPLADNDSITPSNVVKVEPRTTGVVREF